VSLAACQVEVDHSQEEVDVEVCQEEVDQEVVVVRCLDVEARVLCSNN